MAAVDLASELISNVSSWRSEVLNQKAGAKMLVSIALFLIAWYVWIARKWSKGHFPLPPGPRGLPLIGFLPFLDTELHSQFEKLAKIYGPIMNVRLLNKNVIVISSPELAREVMRDLDAIFANRDVTAAALAMTYNGQGIVWAQNGPHLRLVRRVCSRELMSNKALDNIYPLRRREVRQAVREVFSKINTPIDLSEITFQILLNLMISIMWGATLDGEGRRTLSKEFRQWTQDALVLQTKFNVSDLFPVLARFDIQGVVREMNKLSIWLDKVFDSIIDQRRKMDGVEGEDEKKKEGKDFMNLLLQLTEEERKTTFTVTNMKAMMELLVGGTNTTSTMVAWSMGELLKHPHIMRKVQDELEQVVGKNNVVEESHLPDLHYLDAVLKETHRLHPAIPFLVPRSPCETCNVGGYRVPKGCKIIINAWAIQRDPKTWKDALEFKPDRFLTEEFKKCDIRGTDHRFIPFGSGRRMCIGLPLAERMYPYVLASLIHSFDWRWPEGTNYELEDRFGIVSKQAVPLVAIPTARLSNPELYS
ncbi:flavonoid 3'-monooxygenase CYP75B137-like isoform X2 [Tasmannia lanceolata]|uniref:flavonoid 3'-monooxygenase CYP75B137-like isoform X2 n=1 Tax=Tasmannia lanceolata TaxID=3420 RepID=UPI004062A74D